MYKQDKIELTFTYSRTPTFYIRWLSVIFIPHKIIIVIIKANQLSQIRLMSKVWLRRLLFMEPLLFFVSIVKYELYYLHNYVFYLHNIHETSIVFGSKIGQKLKKYMVYEDESNNEAWIRRTFRIDKCN